MYQCTWCSSQLHIHGRAAKKTPSERDRSRVSWKHILVTRLAHILPCSPTSCSLGGLLLQKFIQLFIFMSDRIHMLPILLSGVVTHRGRVRPRVLAEPSKHTCRWHALACKPF